MTDRAAMAVQAAILLAVDPSGLGGATIRAPAGPARDSWLAGLARAIGAGTPWRRMPPTIAEARLIGGLDLAATLAAGRPIAERGLLAEVDQGILVVPMAERLPAGTAGPLAAVLDNGELVAERDGLALRVPTRFALILLDEGLGDERAPEALRERLAFCLDLDGERPAPAEEPDKAAITTARDLCGSVTLDDESVEAICAAGMAFGVPSLRIATLTARAAKAAAALAGRSRVAPDDVALAAALVIAPRATSVPAAEEDEAAPGEQDNDPPEQRSEEQSSEEPCTQPDAADAPTEDGTDAKSLADLVVEATRAAIPAGLLAALGLAAGAARASSATGRAGVARASEARGRPAGVRRGRPGRGARLALVDTLRAAAPWQTIRRKTALADAGSPHRILVRQEDFRLARFKQKSETVTIFVVDASGSSALHRLAEVKGAVELILAECYVRRDSVALIAFRGSGAELILPPTRSLARAKRALAGQAGGGGTPLAAAIEAAAGLADAVRRKGQAPLVVFLTDGKANIARAGQRGRAEAESDAVQAARLFRLGTCPSLLLDTAPRPSEAASRLAMAMGAHYRPLPHADARAMSRIVLDATSQAGRNI